ncbi:MAG TPA: F0F1 ATP synthase subunit alpha [Nitrospiraceae bacterium]|nr:F0F1 ATP synthase subunit alpha [Nitrospiraceae bacterium]
MEKAIPDFWEKSKKEAEQYRFAPKVMEEGTVISVGDDIAHISGLFSARLYELLEFESGDSGIAFDLDREHTGVVILRNKKGVRAGDRVYSTGRVISIGVGEELPGRVLDALGNPLDGHRVPRAETFYPVEREAPSLIQRDFVSDPLYTGIKVIDALLPIGKGQRELIIGDPSSGKTAIAVDTIINQKRSDVICIYVAIGQKRDHILKVMKEIKQYGDASKTVFITADATETLGLQYVAPYSATAIAEYFCDRGRDALVVYDDLSKHANAYRALSLLLKRPPGREAYPGDIFYLHSRLLERPGKLNERYGGGSITALPIVETQQGNISAYIPTNLVSITDGQIYMNTLLLNKGIRPAIDVGKSVSRIGGKAQVEIMKEVAGRLKIDYSRFLEVEVFTKFGMKIEEETAKLITRGERLREILKQPEFQPRTIEEEVLSLMIVESGILDSVELAAVRDRCREIMATVREKLPDILQEIRDRGRLTDTDKERLIGLITAYEPLANKTE